MDPSHKASKNPSDNADLGFQAVGPALRVMQLNVEGLSAAKRRIIQSLAEIHHVDIICLYWKSTRVVNSHLVCDPTIRQPGFDLSRQQWSLLNCFRTFWCNFLQNQAGAYFLATLCAAWY